MAGVQCKWLTSELQSAIAEVKAKHNVNVPVTTLKAIVELWQAENKTEDFPPTETIIGKLFQHGGISGSSHAKTYVVDYQPKGKVKQIYAIRKKEDKSYGIFNKDNEEVFSTESVDRNKIFAKLGILYNDAKIIEHNNEKYIVSKIGEIVSVKTGKIMQWDENNGNRKTILAKYQDLSKSKTDIDFHESNVTGYTDRTKQNASADATIAFAIDFNSAGEKLTKTSVENNGKKYIPIDTKSLDINDELVDNIINNLNSVNAKTINIAGNGLYTLKRQYTQQQIDDYVYNLLNAVVNSTKLKTKIISIRSGGQTGFDEAGAKAGIRLGIHTIILSPKNWTFRDINGKDISNEKLFKERFENNNLSSDLFKLSDSFNSSFANLSYTNTDSQLELFSSAYDNFINDISYNREKLDISELSKLISTLSIPRGFANEFKNSLMERLYLDFDIVNSNKTGYYNLVLHDNKSKKEDEDIEVNSIATITLDDEDVDYSSKKNEDAIPVNIPERTIDTYGDTISVNQKLLSHKNTLYYDYTAKKLQDRIDLLSLLFSLKVDELEDQINEDVKALKQQLIDRNINNKESVDENVIELLKPSSRSELIKKHTPKRIFQYIYDDLQQDAVGGTKIAKEYKLLLKHFWDIAAKTSPYLTLIERVKLSRNFQSEEINNDDLNEIDIESYDALVADPEEQSNREWDKNSKQIKQSDNLASSIRRMLRMIPKVDFNGNKQLDDLGNPKMINANYAYRVLMQNLSKTLYEPQHLISQLQELAKKYPWVYSVIDYIDYQSLEKDDPDYSRTESRFSQFFENFCKISNNYWIQFEEVDDNGVRTIKSKRANKPQNNDFLIDSWRSNINQGNVLVKSSLYDHNAVFNKKLAKKTLDKIDKLINDVNSYEFVNDIPSEIQLDVLDVIQSVGIRLDYGDFRQSVGDNVKEVSKILELLKLPIEGIADGKMDIQTRSDKSKSQTDLFTEYSSKFRDIATILAPSNDDYTEDSAREAKKTWQTYSNSNYLGNLFKKIKSSNAVDFLIEEYGKDSWFYNKSNGSWKNEMIRNLIENEEYRKNFDWKVLLSHNKLEYKNWGDFRTSLILYSEYNSVKRQKGKQQHGYYHMPIYSDAHSSEFIKSIRYVDEEIAGRTVTFEEQLMPLYIQLVKQEIERIALVKNRFEKIQNGEVKPLDNYDIKTKNGQIDSPGGSEFKFLPELNSVTDANGMLFLDSYNSLIQDGNIEAAEQLISDSIELIMNKGVDHMISEFEENGMLERNRDGAYINIKNIDNELVTDRNVLNRILKEYYWNSCMATAQIIQLTTTDLAYYKNDEDFQKRFKEVHASGLRLNPLSEFGKEYETAIYLNDDLIPSNIQEAVNIITDKKNISKVQKDFIKSQFRKLNSTDGQSFRTLKSYRSILSMRGLLTDDLKDSMQRILDGKWDINDFNLVLNSIKPYVFTNVKVSDGFGGFLRVPTQHKNSEALLTMAHAVLIGDTALSKSSKMKDLNDFMLEHDIDVVHFASVVKVGSHSVYDIKNDNYKKYLEDTFLSKDKSELIADRIHSIPYNDYIIQVETPPHFIDTEQFIGTQLRRLISADIDLSKIMSIDVNGKKVSKTIGDWVKIMNDVVNENIEESFRGIMNLFDNIDSLSNFLISEIAGNPRYDQDLLEAFKVIETVNQDGFKEKRFARPINDPLIADSVQSLIYSLFKNRLTKQKIRGGSMVQVSNVGYTDDLNIIFQDASGNKLLTKQEFSKQRRIEGDKLSDEYASYLQSHPDYSVSHYECYMPWYTEKYISKLIDKKTHTLDISKIKDQRLLELIGYRIPTEDTYSMVPLKIVGFLPQQLSGTIMLPADFVAISGSDFDIDKLYIMLNEFVEKPDGLKKIVNPDILSKGEVKGSTRESRNNAMLDIMRGILTHNESVGKMINPGNFNDIERAANKIIVLTNFYSDIPQSEYFKNKDLIDKLKKYSKSASGIEYIINSLNDKELKTLANIFKPRINPLSPRTFIKFYNQNVTGGTLIGVYANHNTSHALMQRLDVAVKKNKFAINFCKSLNNDNRWNLGNIHNGNERLISRNTGQFVSAAVDNAKNPLLNFLNENDFTANAGSYARRLGYEIEEVAAVLAQPIVKEIVAFYILNKSKGYTKKAAIEKIISDRKFDSEERKLPAPGATTQELFYALALSKKTDRNKQEEEEFDRIQNIALSIFYQMFKGGEALNMIVSGNRSDTQAGALSFSTAKSMNIVNKINNFLDNCYLSENEDADISINTLAMIDRTDNHFVNKFSTCTTDGFMATHKYLKQNDNKTILAVKRLIDGSRSESFPEKVLNRYFKEMMTYYLSSLSFFGSDEKMTYKEKYNHFIYHFPDEFNKIKQENPDLESINLIRQIRRSVNPKTNVPYLKFDKIGKLSSEQKHDYKIDWESLLYSKNPIAPQLALSLLLYNYYSNGFNFMPGGFHGLTPMKITELIEGYVDHVNNYDSNSIDMKDYLKFFIRNHLHEKSICPEVKLPISITSNIVDLSDFNYLLTSNGGYLNAFKIYENKKNRYFVNTNAESGLIYYEVSPLNVKNQSLYYDMNSEWSDDIDLSRLDEFYENEDDNGYVDPMNEFDDDSYDNPEDGDAVWSNNKDLGTELQDDYISTGEVKIEDLKSEEQLDDEKRPICKQ